MQLTPPPICESEGRLVHSVRRRQCGRFEGWKKRGARENKKRPRLGISLGLSKELVRAE